MSQAALLKAHPFCIYCGGINRATTIDHCPPKIVFRGKHRPRQFEFPCCDSCNSKTKNTDQLTGFIGRLFPDAKDEIEKEDMQKILGGLRNNMLDALQEMHIGRAGQKLARKRVDNLIGEEGGVLRLDGPIVSRHLDVFACKVGLAMHWEYTKQIVPPQGGVAFRVYSNIEKLEKKIPEDFLKLLPGPDTLRQGEWHVSDQFEYAGRLTDDRQMGMYFVSFRFAFAVAAFTSMDRALLDHRIKPVFAPGELWSN